MIFAEVPFDPQIIIVFIAVAIAAAKAFLERNQKKASDIPPPLEEIEYVDPYDEYEAELERQRAALQIPQVPPPLPVATPPVQKVKKPQLSAAEKAALENLKLQSQRKKKNALSTKSRLKKHLSSPTAAREALLLAEILGPPKAMQDGQARK